MPRKKSLVTISKTDKMALVRTLRDQGMSVRKIGTLLGIPPTTVSRWSSEEEVTPEMEAAALKKYQDQIEEHNKTVLSLAYDQLEKLLPKSESISEVIKAAEFASGQSQKQNQTNVQVNVGFGQKDIKGEYGEF